MITDLGMLETKIQIVEQKAQDWHDGWLEFLSGVDSESHMASMWDTSGRTRQYYENSRRERYEQEARDYFWRKNTRENLYARSLEGRALDPDYM